jgi:histidinol dehydrogenase
VFDFLKRSSVLACDAEALASLSEAALALSEAEGLTAHRHSIAIRLNRQ